MRRVAKPFSSFERSRVWLLTGALAACAGSTKVSEKSELHFEVGRSFYEDGRFPESIAHFQQALIETPDRPDVLLYLGMAHFNMERNDEAAQTLLRACGLVKEYPECWNNLSVVELKRKRPRQAADYARKAFSSQTYPTPENALANWARALVELQDYRQALAKIDQAERLRPGSCGLKQIRVQALVRSQNFEDGLEAARNLTRACPLELSSHLWEGYALYKIGRRKDAASKFEKIPTLFPEGPGIETARKALDHLKRRIPLTEPGT
jgi:Flp pilus assembly protein TadD